MINSVRNSVLSVLNKNNYGYVSPSDFNLYAKQAQIELFEEYFSNYNKVVNAENARSSGSDYSDLNKAIGETLEYFLVNDYLFPFDFDYPEKTRNRFYIPSLTTTGNEAYMVSKLICYPTILKDNSTNDSVLAFYLQDSTATFIADGVQPGDIVANWSVSPPQTAIVYTVISDTSLQISADIFTVTGDDYYIISAQNYSEPEKVSSGKIASLNLSMITTPSSTFPAYTQDYSLMQVYPISTTFSIGLLGQLQATYFRYPKEPKWTYITLSAGEPIFDQSQLDYQDFEMPQEDEFKLVMKILQYCGMSIREIEIAQFAVAQEQHEQPTFSQQQ
jgi:hypothetical protein